VQRMATKKTTPTKKRRTSAREPLLREVEAIDFQTLSALGHYPEVASDGPIPISAAIHWVASEGRKIDHDLYSAEGMAHYNNAASALFGKVALGKVRVIGENEDEKNDFIPCAEFVELKAYFDFAKDDAFQFAACNDRRLEIHVSENGKSLDTFRKPNKRGEWTKIYVFCEEIRSEWPYQGLPRCDNNSPEEFCDAVPSEIQKGPKAEITRQALRSKFRDGLVPKHLSITEICERIKPEMLKLGDSGGADRSTVERLLKRRK
jgi:hypothetical protein